MKLPVSKRLLCCAELVSQGARVADIGCDHGYLSIELLRSGKADFVHACDLRPLPLENAVKNARRFGVWEKMRFSRADGLAALNPEEIDTIVCAGMGGELIANILEAAAWLKSEKYTLVLQPQSQSHELRLRLNSLGFSVEVERLTEENGFIYNILRARYDGGKTLLPGEEYCSHALLRSGDPLLEKYLENLEKVLSIRIQGLSCSADPAGKGLAQYEEARKNVRRMKEEIKCPR